MEKALCAAGLLTDLTNCTSDELKRDAVAQITERGYSVVEASERLSVSQYSLYAWKRQLAKVVSGDTSKDAEIRQLKRELARVTEERDTQARQKRDAVTRTVRTTADFETEGVWKTRGYSLDH